MPIDTSLKPIPDREFGLPQARHLLRRAGFGPAPGEAEQLVRMGLDDAVDYLLHFHRRPVDHLPDPPLDPNLRPYRTRDEIQRLQRARQRNDRATIDQLTEQFLARLAEDRAQLTRLQAWWLHRMINTPRPLQEQLTLLWHSHFATRHRNVRDTWLMFRQNRLFRENAGTFAPLARGIIRDPAMILFLNNNRNYAANPNENLARELLELFTLGEGNYPEQDIPEIARALTGYHLSQDREFTFNHRHHDGGMKTVLGQRASFDGDDVVNRLLAQPECPRFISYKLYKHFVDDHVSQPLPAHQQQVIRQMARHLARNDYQVGPVLHRLFRSRHFYDPGIVGQKIKNPAQLLVGTVRMLQTPTRDDNRLLNNMRTMGQTFFDPPSVAGWDGGRTWINTSTLFIRQNLASYLIAENPGSGQPGYDPTSLLDNLEDRSPRVVVDHLVNHAVGDHLPDDRRRPLVHFLQERGGQPTADNLAGLLMLVTAMPEYQLC